MRIFCAVRHSIDPQFYYGGLWSSNFYPALREHGCEIVESQTDLLPTSRFMSIAGDFTPQELAMRAYTTERILDEVREAKRQGPVHLFLSYFYNAHFDPAGLEELRRLGIPSVNFYCNSIYQLELVAEIARHVDFSWHPERNARQSYLSIGANPIWVQMGANPYLYRPVHGIERQPKACFVGQRYADRDRLLAALLEASVAVDIYGAGWRADDETPVARSGKERNYLGRRQITPGTLTSYLKLMATELQQHGIFSGTKNLMVQAAYRRETRRLMQNVQLNAKGSVADLASVFSAYEVCLNFSNVWANTRPGSQLLSHVRLRDFEAPMCRSCYLTGYSEEIAELYALGREIDTYRDKLELVDKSRFYLANPDVAEKLREAGYRRALADHTWKRRFEELFRIVGLNASHP
jgi:spore maturation protein CgeB